MVALYLLHHGGGVLPDQVLVPSAHHVPVDPCIIFLLSPFELDAKGLTGDLPGFGTCATLLLDDSMKSLFKLSVIFRKGLRVDNAGAIPRAAAIVGGGGRG